MSVEGSGTWGTEEAGEEEGLAGEGIGYGEGGGTGIGGEVVTEDVDRLPVDGFMEKGEFKSARIGAVEVFKGETIEQQHNIADCIDVPVEIDVGVLESVMEGGLGGDKVAGMVGQLRTGRQNLDVLGLRRYGHGISDNKVFGKGKMVESDIASVSSADYHPYRAGIADGVALCVADAEIAR